MIGELAVVVEAIPGVAVHAGAGGLGLSVAPDGEDGRIVSGGGLDARFVTAMVELSGLELADGVTPVFAVGPALFAVRRDAHALQGSGGERSFPESESTPLGLRIVTGLRLRTWGLLAGVELGYIGVSIPSHAGDRALHLVPISVRLGGGS